MLFAKCLKSWLYFHKKIDVLHFKRGEMGKGNKIKGIYEKETDPCVFVEKTNKLNHGFSLEYDGEAYYLIYPQCYCSYVKRSPEHLSKAWCYCTLGYRKRMFESCL